MAEKLSTEPYKGVRDFYPEDWARMEALFTIVRRTLTGAGYEEYQASPLERSEIYEAKTSEEIVSNETYSFTDRGDRRVTLRPEMTPTLARMVAARRRELTYPLRWFSIGDRFRYERPQKGRLREFFQADVDLVGSAFNEQELHEEDLEILTLASAILRAFGAKESQFSIRVNARPLLNAACLAAGLSEDGIRAYLRLLDKKAKMEAGAFSAELSKITDKDPLAIIENASEDPLVAAEKKRLLDLLEQLKTRGVGNALLDPTITRGFDYYTGIVFEIYDTDPSNARSLFGGGRYDKLVGLFGVPPVPAAGFAIGDATLADFLETHGLALPTDTHTPELYIGTPVMGDIPAAQAFARDLREKGFRILVNTTERALGDQVKDAVKRGIPLFLAYGHDELASGSVRVKQLQTGTEEAFSVLDLPAHLLAKS